MQRESQELGRSSCLSVWSKGLPDESALNNTLVSWRCGMKSTFVIQNTFEKEIQS